MNSLIAINILNNDKILNKNYVPILFYWDGKTEVETAIKTDPSFQEWVSKNILDKKKYGFASIAYCYYKYNPETNEEEYNDVSKLFQQWLTIDELPELEENIVKSYFDYLYQCSFKKPFEFTGYYENDLNTIYKLIKEKFPNKISKTTVIKYVQSELSNKDGLVIENINKIVNKLEKIIND